MRTFAGSLKGGSDAEEEDAKQGEGFGDDRFPHTVIDS